MDVVQCNESSTVQYSTCRHQQNSSVQRVQSSAISVTQCTISSAVQYSAVQYIARYIHLSFVAICVFKLAEGAGDVGFGLVHRARSDTGVGEINKASIRCSSQCKLSRV